MKFNSALMISLLLSGASLSLCNSFDDLQEAIRKSDFETVRKMVTNSDVLESDLTGLVPLADEIMALQQQAITDRRIRVYSSIVLKCLPGTIVGPIIGFVLDQRALGIVMGINSLICGGIISTGVLLSSVKSNRTTLGAAGALIGFGLTAGAVAGFVMLERWFWKKESNSYDQLQRKYQEALKIKSLLCRRQARGY